MGGPRRTSTAEVLMFIETHIADRGYGPSVREIQEETGLSSTAAVHHHLSKLKEAGLIDWEPGKARTLRVI